MGAKRVTVRPERVTVRLTGATWDAQFCDRPDVPQPSEVKRMGRGHQYVFRVTYDEAADMLDRLRVVADLYGPGYDYEPGERRAVLSDLKRLEDQLARVRRSGQR